MLSNILYVLYCLSPGSLLGAGSLVGTGPLDSRSLVGVDIDANAGADLDSAGFLLSFLLLSQLPRPAWPWSCPVIIV